MSRMRKMSRESDYDSNKKKYRYTNSTTTHTHTCTRVGHSEEIGKSAAIGARIFLYLFRL